MIDKIIFIVGPTASGKTQVAADLARKLPLEVVSCDSMQVYEGMEIISGAPESRILKNVPHHLFQIIKPTARFDVSRFRKETLQCLPRIQKRNHLPCIVGGTGLYANALLDGLFKGPGRSHVRAKLEKEARSNLKKLYATLELKDPNAARIIHPNDARRITRALEVIQVTGKRFSKLKQVRSGVWDPARVRIYGLNWERATLYERINQRVDGMFRRGLIAEGRPLLKKRLSLTAKGCLGLAEVKAILEKKMTRLEAKEHLKRRTRQFAKRQLSWFRRDQRIQWITPRPTLKSVAPKILKDLKPWLNAPS